MEKTIETVVTKQTYETPSTRVVELETRSHVLIPFSQTPGEGD